MRTDLLTFRRWLLGHAIVILSLFVLGVALFAAVAGRLDNEFAETARREHMDTVVMTQVNLLPAYVLIWLLHACLTFVPAARRWRRRGTRPGLFRLVFSAALWTLAIFVLSLGPVTYVSPASLDTLAWIGSMISPSLNLYAFKTWHLQEVFTGVFALLAALAALRFAGWLLRTTQRLSPPVRTAVVGLVALVALAPLGWAAWESREPERRRAPLPNVIVIGADSLRADHFGFQGYPRDVSPAIDGLAKDGVVFDEFYVSTASTLESWTSFLTGKYPANHGLRYMFISKEQADGVSRDENTLPRILRKKGYTSSVVGDWAANCFALVDYGFDRTLTSDVQNLDVFLCEVAFRTHLLIPHYFSHAFGERLIPNMRQVTGYMNADHLTEKLIGELDDAAEQGRPFFGVLFLSCTHLPYMAKYPYNVKFTDPDYRGPNRFRLGFDVDDFIQDGFADAHSPEEKQQVIDLYDGGVAQFDSHVKRVLDHLESTGLDDNTIVIITSDHGEDLYEPGTTLGHGTNFFGGDQANRIPLVVRLPGGRHAGRRVKQITRNVDFMPTLLELVGAADAAPEGMDGVSLMPYVEGSEDDLGLTALAETCYLFFPKKVPGEEVFAMEPADRTLYIDADFENQFVLKPKYHDYVIETKDRMIRTERWKLVYIKGKNGPIWRLYDMKADPQQLTDVAAQNPRVLAELRERLRAWIDTGKDQRWPRALDG